QVRRHHAGDLVIGADGSEDGLNVHLQWSGWADLRRTSHTGLRSSLGLRVHARRLHRVSSLSGFRAGQDLCRDTRRGWPGAVRDPAGVAIARQPRAGAHWMVVGLPASVLPDGHPLTEAARAWLAALERCVRAVDYAAARPLFAPDVQAFGTHAAVVSGRDILEREQWQHIWPTIREFTFRLAEMRCV